MLWTYLKGPNISIKNCELTIGFSLYKGSVVFFSDEVDSKMDGVSDKRKWKAIEGIIKETRKNKKIQRG